MITKLLKSINKQLEELNGLLKDSDYLKELENKIEIVNKSINREHQENILLKHRVEKAIEYLENHKLYIIPTDLLDILKGDINGFKKGLKTITTKRSDTNDNK